MAPTERDEVVEKILEQDRLREIVQEAARRFLEHALNQPTEVFDLDDETQQFANNVEKPVNEYREKFAKK